MNLILAILGQTKFGKSTLLALLSNIFLRLLKIFSKANGRTKTLTEYFYDKNNDNCDIWIMDMVIRQKECLGGFQNDVEVYNKNLLDNPVLARGLGLEPLEQGIKPSEYLTEKISAFKNRPITDEEIERLLCTKGLDEFIKKIVIRVPANSILKAYMDRTSVSISIRDTKGLLDFSMDDKMEKSNGNLSEIGLDNIDGAIFGCSENYPNVILEIYKDTLQNVFKSVPTFFIAKDQMMQRIYGKSKSVILDDVSRFIDEYRIGQNENYIDMDDVFFRDTNQLFTDLGIMKKDDGEYSFSETYFGKNETEFIIPMSTTLKKYSTGDVNDKQLAESSDFVFLQAVASLSVIKMIDLIIKFKGNVERLKKDGYAKKYMELAALKTRGELLVDFAKYNNNSHGYASTYYCKPQLKSVTDKMIEAAIDDQSVDILGPNNGITTKNNGKLKYFSTAIVAVSARKWLDHIIGCVEITEDICDQQGNVLFSGLEGNIEAQKKLVKNILRNCLYKEYTDVDATIQYHLCVDRCKACFGIQERRKAPTLQSAFEQTIEIIVNDLCRTLVTSEVGVEK